jgi:co-chaperonin GroES (HSP10)
MEVKQMLKPQYDYILGEEIVQDTGVVTTTDIEETKQYYKVIAVGPGRFIDGVLSVPTVEPGDFVIIQKHAAEGDTPPDLLSQGKALFMATRVMAVIRGDY